MSFRKWAYSPEKCDGDFCPGDCDFCHKAEDEEPLTGLGREIPKEELHTVSIDEIRSESHEIDRR